MRKTQPPITADQTPQQRLRLTYAKGQALQYISHLDLARTWERVFRRAGLPVAYSQGFNPRPRFQIAAALPVGVTGREELLDLWLLKCLDPEEVVEGLQPALPRGLEALNAVPVDLRAPSLQSQLRAASYRVAVSSPETTKSIDGRVQALMALPSVPRQRQHKGKWQTYDLRPLIQCIEVKVGKEGQQLLLMRLQASPQGAGRPDEVLDVLGLSLAPHRLERTNLCFEFDK